MKTQITIARKVYSVIYVEDLKDSIIMFHAHTPKWISYDTETTGLHLKKDVPFVGAVCWSTDKVKLVYVFPTTKSNLEMLKFYADCVRRIYCHNTLFDMCMTANITGDDFVKSIKNWGDTQGLMRVCVDAVSPRDGGDRMALKYLADKYIDKDSSRYETEVKAWLKAKVAADRKVFIALLKAHGWTMKRYDAAMTTGAEEIPEDVMETVRQWRRDYPEPTYKDVPMDIMLPYVATDVVLCDIIIEMTLPIIKERKQGNVVAREFANLPVTFKMLRRGFKADRDYLLESAARLDDYIEDLQIKMYELAGREFSVSQHAVIKDIYEERTGIRPESTDSQFLSKRIAEERDELAKHIKALRSLEKWQSTYAHKLLEMSEYDGRIYASLNQFGTISGRHSGDFQQMPKEALLTLEGEELFHPRKAIIVDEGSKIFFLDQSQQELRVQAHNTIMTRKGGDLNLCRAYMPFKCVHNETGEIYNFETEEGKARWNEYRSGAPAGHWEDVLKEGWSAWIVPETKQPWVPTDVHSATTIQALDLMGMGEVDAATFKHWRYIGKRYNFMKTYGGGPKKSAEVLEITLEECTAIDEGFKQSFPTIVTYQEEMVELMHMQGYVENMYNRRYYITNNRKFYKVANYNIQGPCADDLKEKIVKIDELLEDRGYRSQILMPIHDELVFEIVDGEEDIVPELQKIMEYTPGLYVPFVVEAEYTTTNWAEKHKFEGVV